jgi:hypothetical protein
MGPQVFVYFAEVEFVDGQVELLEGVRGAFFSKKPPVEKLSASRILLFLQNS